MNARVREVTCNGLELPSDKPDNGKPLRILHLSDLHFGAHFDDSLWDYIRDVLAGSEKPDVIVVTGDLVDTPSLFMLGLARKQLLAMRSKWSEKGRACELIVIPGNHDVGIYGNLSVWPWSSKFDIVFGPEPHKVFDGLPAFSAYRKWKWYKRWAHRSWWSCRFALLRLSGQLPAARPEQIIKDAAGNRLCFACLDSNRNLKLASGRVEHASILRIHGELLKRRHPDDNGALLNLVPRIALVHHHVIPVPYSGAVESATEFEPFLVLRNAGTLLRELCDKDFDLVLHGHKHFLNFARLTFDSADEGDREIAVLAAGSATTHQTGAGANSFNLIKVYPNGCIWFRSIRYGQGQSGEMEGAWNSGFQRLLRPEKLKRRVHTRAYLAQQIGCDVKAHEYVVDVDGCADVRVSVMGFRGTDEEKVRLRHEGFCVGYGAVDPASIFLDNESLNAGHSIEGLPTVPSRSAEFQVRLSGARMGSTEGVDYSFKCLFMNTFAITPWECHAMGRSGVNEWVAAAVRVPTRKLRLSVKLPPSFKSPSPHVVVDRLPDYPLLGLNEQGEVKVSSGLERWERDPDFTHFEKTQLRYVEGCWLLEVDYPLLGHRYQIRWTVDCASLPTTIERSCRALQLRKSLIELCHSDDDAVQKVGRFGRDMLQKITGQILRPLIGSSLSFHETLDAALFVYDDERRNLRMVATSSPEIETRVNEIPLNAGVGGAAFKSRRVKVFVCPRGSRQGGVYVYFPESVPLQERPKFAALIAIPLHLGDVLPEDRCLVPAQVGNAVEEDLRVAPEELIGVFTVGSTAYDSRLASLGIDADMFDAQQQLLTDEIWSVATQYLQGLSDAIRRVAQRDCGAEEAAA
jgi:hypothetical protein